MGALVIANPAHAQEIYKDPDGRFSLQLPAGWADRTADRSYHPEWGSEGKLFGRNGDGSCWIWVQTERKELLSSDGLQRFRRATADMTAARQYFEDMQLITPSVTVDSIKAETIDGESALQVRYSSPAAHDTSAPANQKPLTWIALFSAQPQRNDLLWCTVASPQLDRVEPMITALFHSYRMTR
jgi:hypothetical protein